MAKSRPAKPHQRTSDGSVSVRIEDKSDDYRGFFDHAWAQSLHARTTPIAEINKSVNELLFSLKATSNAFRFPWLAVKLHTDFVAHFLNNSDPIQVEFLKHVRACLRSTVTEESVGRQIDEALKQASVMMLSVQSCRQEMRRAAVESVSKDAFSAYMQASEFQLTLIGLMRNTYTSLIFAYEHFFVSCFRWKADDPDAQSMPAASFRQRVLQFFDSNICEECWTGPEVRKHFEIRNSLAHEGGRFSSRLDRWNAEIEQLSGTIQVTATDVRVLFEAIRRRVDLLADDLLKSGKHCK